MFTTFQTSTLASYSSMKALHSNNHADYYNVKMPVFKPLDKDTISFKGYTKATIEDLSYKTVLEKRLVSTPNTDFKEKLRNVRGINNQEIANDRISALSRYLKEDMIGFIVPEYTINGEKKGGYEWFEKALPNLLWGATKAGKKGLSKEGTIKTDPSRKLTKNELKKARKHPPVPDDYKSVAKELFGLLALHDNYWKSNNFISYLERFEKTDPIVATIEAIKELQTPKSISFAGDVIKVFGYFSPLKIMPELLEKGGAYSTNKLSVQDIAKDSPIIPEFENASLEHIFPKSWGGECDDSNYMLASEGLNSLRGNLPLITFLKGSNA